MERTKVYEIIDTERDYQIAASKQKDNIRPDKELALGEILTAIRYNLFIAEQQWYASPEPYQGSMIHLRKIAGLAVQAMEKYPTPPRVTL